MSYEDEKAIEVIERMLKTDCFSQWMDVKVLEIRDGYSRIQMLVRNEMLNSFGIAHGGVTFAFADSAFAFACNSDGRATLALDASMSFTKAVKEHDILVAEAKQVNKTKRTGLYIVEVSNQRFEVVALFKGTCYTPSAP